MEHRKLGDSGLRVSALAYGGWLTHAEDTAGAARKCISAALDLGISTFDTADVYGAPAYGAAEEILGAALSGIRRESVELLTKVCGRTGPGANDQGLSRKHIIESCHASLRRLKTDYIDLYQAHRYDDGTPIEETMAALAGLVRQGKVLYLGVSEWTATQIETAAALAAELGVSLIANQPQYSMLWRVVEAEVVPTCARLGIGQLAWSPLAQGVLTGKYLPGQPTPANSRAAHERGTRFVGRYMGDAVLTGVQRLRPIADILNLSLAQLAVAWVLQNPHVSSAIIGATRPDQLRHNAAAAGVRLDGNVLASIDAAFTDDVHGDLVERDSSKIADPFNVKPSWR